MKNYLTPALATLILAAALFVSIPGCGPSAPVITVNQSEIKSNTDPITENILSGLNKGDYALFSQNFAQSFKSTLDRTAFEQLSNQLKNTIGNYQTKAFFDANAQGSIVTVAYICRYTNEPAGVTVIETFNVTNSVYSVEGLTLNSPKLAGQSLDVTTLRTYADGETENILNALNDSDHAAFSKDLNQTMKDTMTKTAFTNLSNQLKTTVGNYQSKVFEAATTANNIITVQYLASYSAEPDGVWITISFDSNKKIAGLYFNSPKLLTLSK